MLNNYYHRPVDNLINKEYKNKNIFYFGNIDCQKSLNG